jgi:hypothetical protein
VRKGEEGAGEGEEGEEEGEEEQKERRKTRQANNRDWSDTGHTQSERHPPTCTHTHPHPHPLTLANGTLVGQWAKTVVFTGIKAPRCIASGNLEKG